MLRCPRGGGSMLVRGERCGPAPQAARSGAQLRARRCHPGRDQSGGQMAGESSFDVVSDFDDQEMRNALDQ